MKRRYRNGLVFLAAIITPHIFLGCASHKPFFHSEAEWKSDKPSVESTIASLSTGHAGPNQPVVQVAGYLELDGNEPATEPNVTSNIPSKMVPIDASKDNPAVQLSGMTLSEFESLALGNNPTIAQLVATTQKAAGFRTQVGLRANPAVGYNGTQIADQGTDQHTAFITQTLVTADKLALNRRVQNEALRAQLMLLEAQKYRVVTDVRTTFFEALAAQKQATLIREFQSLAAKGVELAELRKLGLEGSQLDVLQAKVQQNEIDLALQQAEIGYSAAWRELTALAGVTNLQPMPLQGELPATETNVDWSVLADSMVQSSPEYRAAQARVNQAAANLQRQNVQAIPNVDFMFASGRDNGTDSGMINVQVGAPIPVFNKNQGNITAARAEQMRACRELERIENSIRSRVAAISGDYDSSLAAVTKYTSDILPNAAEGLKLAEAAYQAGETSFIQVLVARRTYFDTNQQFIVAQAQLAQARAQLDGFVLTGALDAVEDGSGDDGLRDMTFGQQ